MDLAFNFVVYLLLRPRIAALEVRVAAVISLNYELARQHIDINDDHENTHAKSYLAQTFQQGGG